ncbi:hypothetical protein lerEdw1_019467 [Lerista edwardsae]|nr:hypothetical protein lerEdw1_019467 [Lerista edwardsae]
MVRKFEVLSRHLALLSTLVLLGLASVEPSSTSCQGCPADALAKAKQHVMYLKRPTKHLYKSYFRRMGLGEKTCARAVDWFPSGSIASEPINVTLQELHRTLEFLVDSLDQIAEQQKFLQLPTSPLPSQLQQAWLEAKGLRVNARCALCNQGLTPPAITLPERQAEPAFTQKVEGCRVLWGYSKFISALAKAFQKPPNKKGSILSKLGCPQRGILKEQFREKKEAVQKKESGHTRVILRPGKEQC